MRKIFVNKINFIIYLMFFFISIHLMATPIYSTYRARILKYDSKPLEKSKVNFKFTILNPNKNCTLYTESYSLINMEGSNGYVSFNLGSGIKGFPTDSTKFIDVIKNNVSLNCLQGGTFIGNTSDSRVIIMQFNDIETAKWQTTLPMTLNSVPYANYASHADTATQSTMSNDSALLNGYSSSAFVQVSSLPSGCSVGQVLSYVSGSFSCVSSSGSNSLENGGNSFAGNAVIGTTDAYALQLNTNNTTRLTISNQGDIGIGTSTPLANLHLTSTQSTSGVILGSIPDFTGSFNGFYTISYIMLGKDVTNSLTSGGLDYSIVNIGPTLTENNTSTNWVNILTSQTRVKGSGQFAGVAGINSIPIYEGTGQLTSGVYALNAGPTLTSGSIENLVGFYSFGAVFGGTVNTFKGMQIDSPYLMGGAINNSVGINIADQNQGATKIALSTNQSSGYTFFNSGSAPSYFAGQVGIGTQLASATLHVVSSSSTSGVVLGDVPNYNAGYSSETKNVYARIGKNATNVISNGLNKPYAVLELNPLLIQNTDATSLSSYIIGVQSEIAVSGTANISEMYGIDSGPRYYGQGTIQNLIGVNSKPVLQNSGNVTYLTSFASWGEINNSNVTAFAGLYLLSPELNGISTLTNNYGIYIEDMNTGTNKVAIKTNQSAGYTMHNSGNAPSYFAGHLGLGNASPSSLLHVGNISVGSGQAVANFESSSGVCTIVPASSGSGIACSSDERLKENFEDVTGKIAIDKILKLQAYSYNYKVDSHLKRHTGYKAQQVQTIEPNFVRTDHRGYLQVFYDAFIPWITESIKYIYNKVIIIENNQEKIQNEFALLKDDYNKLKKENEIKDLKLNELEKKFKALDEKVNHISK